MIDILSIRRYGPLYMQVRLDASQNQKSKIANQK
jgi:hypothetical protein